MRWNFCVFFLNLCSHSRKYLYWLCTKWSKVACQNFFGGKIQWKYHWKCKVWCLHLGKGTVFGSTSEWTTSKWKLFSVCFVLFSSSLFYSLEKDFFSNVTPLVVFRNFSDITLTTTGRLSLIWSLKDPGSIRLQITIISLVIENFFNTETQLKSQTRVWIWFLGKRAFFWDLDVWPDEAPNDDPHQPIGTDYRTLLAILLSAYKQTQVSWIHLTQWQSIMFFAVNIIDWFCWRVNEWFILEALLHGFSNTLTKSIQVTLLLLSSLFLLSLEWKGSVTFKHYNILWRCQVFQPSGRWFWSRVPTMLILMRMPVVFKWWQMLASFNTIRWLQGTHSHFSSDNKSTSTQVLTNINTKLQTKSNPNLGRSSKNGFCWFK